MSEDQSQSSEWRISAAAAGALQLSSRLARPAAWAARMNARGRPLVVGSFGAEIAHRFSTVSAPGALALSLAERFLPGQSQPSSGELTLASHGSPQRDIGLARWSDPTPPFVTSAEPNAASAPLLGELSASGWGAPVRTASALPAAQRIVETPVARPTAAPRVARQAEQAATPPSQAATPPMPSPEANPVPPADLPAPATRPIHRQTDDLPAPTAQDRADAPVGAPDASADTAQFPPQAMQPVQRSEIQPSGEPPALSRTTRSPAARSLDASTPQSPVQQRPQPAPPASNAAPLARTLSPEHPATLPPDLALLRPAVLRSTALLRPLPLDPLQRMGVVPQGALAPTAPLLAGGPPPAMLAAKLPLVQAPSGTSTPTSAPAASASAPVAHPAETGAEETLMLAPDTPATLESAGASGPPAGASAPESSAQRSAAPVPVTEIGRAEAMQASEVTQSSPAPAAEIAQTTSVSTTEIARSEAVASPASPAIGEAQWVRAIPRTGPFSGAPISLTTLVLQRHTGNSAGGSAPLVLLRTRPPSPPLQRQAEESTPHGAMIRRVDEPPAASHTGFEAPLIGRSAAVVPFPLASVPEPVGAHAFPVAGMPEQTATGAPIDDLPLSPTSEPTAPVTPSAADPGHVARVADWGAFPLLQRGMATDSLTQQTGGLLMLRRHPILGSELRREISGGAELPAAAVGHSTEMRGPLGSAGAGLGQFASIVGRTAETRGPIGSAGAGLGQFASIVGRTAETRGPIGSAGAGLGQFASIVGRAAETRGPIGSAGAGLGQFASAAPSSADSGYEQWTIPELALEQPGTGIARLADVDVGPLLQRRLAATGAGVPAGVSAYVSPALDLAQPVRAELQRAPSDMPSPAPSQPDGAQAPGSAQEQGAMNIENIAQKVYEHLRRRLLIEHERRGRPL